MSRFGSPETDLLLEEMAEMRSGSVDRHGMANRSNSTMMSSSPNGSGGASSSKAVLAALKALQEKIRRLETEKVQVMDEASTLRNQLRSQEIESEHIRQRDGLYQQKTNQELKIVNDKLMNERNDIEQHAEKLDERLKEQMRVNTQLNERLLRLQEERDAAAFSYKELETSYRLSDAHVARCQQREKDLTDTLTRELSKRDESIQSLSHSLASKNNQVAKLEDAYTLHSAKIDQLNAFVRKILAINEKLVAKFGAAVSTSAPPRPFAVVRVDRRPLATGAGQPAKRPSSAVVPRRRMSEADEAEYYRSVHSSLGDEFSKIKLSRSPVKKTTKKVKPAPTLINTRKAFVDSVSGGPQRVMIHVPEMRRAELDDYSSDSPGKSKQYNYSSMSFEESASPLKKADMSSVIASVEGEHEELTAQYKQLTQNGRRMSAGGDSNIGGEMVTLLQKIQKKEEQLFLLKSIQT